MKRGEGGIFLAMNWVEWEREPIAGRRTVMCKDTEVHENGQQFSVAVKWSWRGG